MNGMIEQIRQAPISLVLSGLALVLFVVPALGSHLEFRFKDFLWLDLSQDLGQHHQPLPSLAHWQVIFRIFGCNWLHWSANHLFWDTLMFFAISRLCERQGRTTFLGTTIASATLIPPIVMITTPELASYRGLSGIDTALFALLAMTRLLTEIRRQQWIRSLVFLVLLFGMAAKIAYEMTAHQTLFVSDTSFTPVPIAHLTGAAIGIIGAVIASRNDR
jgi:rhomboid family GlyGly-CTERM serine protease